MFAEPQHRAGKASGSRELAAQLAWLEQGPTPPHPAASWQGAGVPPSCSLQAIAKL